MIKMLLIQALLRQLLDPATRQRIADLIATVADVEMSGEAKRNYVIAELNTMGGELSSWAVNLAIELLVAKHKV